MPRLHWRHHYPLFPSPQVTLTHTYAHIRACCAWVPTVRCHRDLFFFFLFPTSCLEQFSELWQGLMLILAVYIYWIPMVACTRGCWRTSLNHLLLEGKKKKKLVCHEVRETTKKKSRKDALFLMEFEKWNCGRSANAPKSIHFRTINPRLGSKKRKGLWPKTFIFHSYSSPELCRWMGPFGDLESLARARWMGLWTFPRPQQQQSDVSLFERAFFFKNVA